MLSMYIGALKKSDDKVSQSCLTSAAAPLLPISTAPGPV